jgi:HPt (histidine-containing phosphotransfer) domain-containing protein
VVRWPGEPDALYHALNEVVVCPGVSQSAIEQPAIEPDVFASLEASLGRASLIEILRSYVTNAEELVEALKAASSTERWSDTARIAQDIAGAAGGFGLAALSAAARALVQQTREAGEPRALRAAAEKVASEHIRVQRALAGLYPDLAA